MVLLLDGRLAEVPAVLLLDGRLLLAVGRLLVEGRMLLAVGRLLLDGLLALVLGRDVLPFTEGREAELLTALLLLGTLGLAPPTTLLLCWGLVPLPCGGVIIEVAELLPWRTLAT